MHRSCLVSRRKTAEQCGGSAFARQGLAVRVSPPPRTTCRFRSVSSHDFEVVSTALFGIGLGLPADPRVEPVDLLLAWQQNLKPARWWHVAPPSAPVTARRAIPALACRSSRCGWPVAMDWISGLSTAVLGCRALWWSRSRSFVASFTCQTSRSSDPLHAAVDLAVTGSGSIRRRGWKFLRGPGAMCSPLRPEHLRWTRCAIGGIWGRRPLRCCRFGRPMQPLRGFVRWLGPCRLGMSLCLWCCRSRRSLETR